MVVDFEAIAAFKHLYHLCLGIYLFLSRCVIRPHHPNSSNGQQNLLSVAPPPHSTKLLGLILRGGDLCPSFVEYAWLSSWYSNSPKICRRFHWRYKISTKFMFYMFI